MLKRLPASRKDFFGKLNYDRPAKMCIRDSSEMHLQVAADELKNMFREILNNELKKEDGR